MLRFRTSGPLRRFEGIESSIANGLLALLLARWPVARSQFTTLNLSDSTHSQLTNANGWQLNLEAANHSDYFFEKETNAA